MTSEGTLSFITNLRLHNVSANVDFFQNQIINECVMRIIVKSRQDQIMEGQNNVRNFL